MRAPGRLLRAGGRRSRHSVGARRVRGARDEFRRARDTSRLLRSRLHAIGSAVAQTHDTLRGRLRTRLERARARRLAGRAPERRPRLRVRARAHAGFRRGGRVRLPVRYVGVRLREGARRKTRGRRARQANARFRAGAGLLRLARRRLQRRARARRVRGGDARRRERTPVRARRSAPKIAGGGGGARARRDAPADAPGGCRRLHHRRVPSRPRIPRGPFRNAERARAVLRVRGGRLEWGRKENVPARARRRASVRHQRHAPVRRRRRVRRDGRG